mmetsp:Transcript_15730/g.45341  ORF Transcript_15730/g.45341 Transcript_15730/m.45341 type:complete len:83 (-) Transcript_15730:808-1056(-)
MHRYPTPKEVYPSNVGLVNDCELDVPAYSIAILWAWACWARRYLAQFIEYSLLDLGPDSSEYLLLLEAPMEDGELDDEISLA